MGAPFPSAESGSHLIPAVNNVLCIKHPQSSCPTAKRYVDSQLIKDVVETSSSPLSECAASGYIPRSADPHSVSLPIVGGRQEAPMYGCEIRNEQ
jgi:hypothetical protein